MATAGRRVDRRGEAATRHPSRGLLDLLQAANAVRLQSTVADKAARDMALEIEGMLLLAGVGNMGQALLSGWLQQGLDAQRVVVQDPAPPPSAKALLERHRIAAHVSITSLAEPPT